MSPRIFSCVLCGYIIYDYEFQNSVIWLKRFRALYSSPTGIRISGIGLYNDHGGSNWIVPLDFAARCDDDSQTRVQVGVMEQRPVNGRHGFVFHDACWSLLEKAYYPEGIPYVRLFKVCKSLPFPLQGTSVSWGHDFGGLVVIDNQDHYPWEDRLIEGDGHSELYLSAKENPYDVPEIQQLLKESPQSLPGKKELSSSAPLTAGVDCFTRLPEEICNAIAALLPTLDVLNLRQTSRAFVPIFSSQQFWASRFKANGDRRWLFETWDSKGSRDWRWLYRRTNDAHSSPGLLNRKRVWKLIQPLKDLLSLRWNESSEQSLLHLNPSDFKWGKVSGDVKQEKPAGTYHDFNEGCRLFHRQRILLPHHFSQIAFSIVRLGDVTYIAGMRLIPSEGADVCLGYWTEGKELFVNVATLRGFNLAIGPRGIQAIQVITSKRCVSEWVGCPDESPKTHRLATSGPIAALEAGFDGCKMVSLMVGEKLSPDMEMSMEQNKLLWDTALWYPEIPEPGLYMNDYYAVGENPSTIEYQPLFWTLFGGPGGIYLRSLTAVSVTCLGSLRGIEFHYNTDEVQTKYRKLGRRKATEYAQVIRFSIDGPGGETIEAVEVNLKYIYGENVYSFCKYGALISFKISTNHDRSCYFGPPQVETDELTVKPIVITPGSTITGFYASQHPEMGLTSLGVMSEVLREPFSARISQ